MGLRRKSEAHREQENSLRDKAALGMLGMEDSSGGLFPSDDVSALRVRKSKIVEAQQPEMQEEQEEQPATLEEQPATQEEQPATQEEVPATRGGKPKMIAELPDSPEGWRTVLNPNQFAVLRTAATEPSGYSEGIEGQLEHTLKKDYKTKYPQEGAYTCIGCGAALYYARSKFSSGCGWPAFYDGVPGAIEEKPDPDGSRIEIVCNKCKGHLGHVFKGEGFPTPTNERHCVNGICLAYDPAAAQPDDVPAVPFELRKQEIPM